MSFKRENLPDAESYFEGIGLKLQGPRSAKWKTTRCEFHDGSDSMRVNLASGGWCCMACGESGGDVLAYEMKRTGADFVTAAKSLGAWVDDGKPLASVKPAPLSPRQALSVLGFEAYLVAIAGTNVARGVKLTETDLLRVRVAAERLHRIAGVYQ